MEKGKPPKQHAFFDYSMVILKQEIKQMPYAVLCFI